MTMRVKMKIKIKSVSCCRNWSTNTLHMLIESSPVVSTGSSKLITTKLFDVNLNDVMPTTNMTGND